MRANRTASAPHPKTRTLAATCAVVCLLSAGAAAAQESAFGCVGLDTNAELPVVEGKDGVFFRINADLRMNHPFSDLVVQQMGALSDALAANGTRLVYVPIPTKSVTMPEFLPDVARLYGFDLDVATEVHLDILRRLEEVGVTTADVRANMLNASSDGELAFFRPDFHWTATGASLAAEVIAERLQGLPEYEASEAAQYVTDPIEVETAFSGMRRILQKRCTETLPLPQTMTWNTHLEQSGGELDLGDLGLGGDDAATEEEDAPIDLFGDDVERISVALVGTSFSDSPINNFPGFIAEHTQREVVNYAITGGNQFGAITSYLTSAEFAEARPHVLIWENPIYNNLAQYGDQPMRELIAAASDTCTTPVPVEISEDRRSLRADLAEFAAGEGNTLFLDTNGSTSLEVAFRFANADDEIRVKSIERGERLRRTGRFYMPMSGLWPQGATSVEVALEQPLGREPALFMCDPLSGPVVSSSQIQEEKS